MNIHEYQAKALLKSYGAPVSDNGDGQQSSPDHLGDAHKETGISAANVLTAPTAKRCKTLK